MVQEDRNPEEEILYIGGHRRHAQPFQYHYPYQLDQGLATEDQILTTRQEED